MIGNITDWAILAVVVIVLFGGAKKIPELARSMGKAMGEFRKGQAEIEKEVADIRASTDITAPAKNMSQQSVKDATPQAHKQVNEDTEYDRRRISQLEEELKELKEKAGA
ncbi:MAG: twin-arginine translocase TatA/TatE family subunit [Nitrososphaerota archaeon]|jgi:sec-independent protein translocase protein TatA|nr:twin-arginine translocase TatA/TatE family subunit [Nitrososphaerota archaeon]MDG6903896.1 twin-arginine translocase TatA/TatE family subunit [Nitrososphaerota archaeon]MDG6912462.1 twin-arginine translocase TatA/TatE family subunit [Nitrososphaerota archaeon]MDG6919192.1 twin-arginine translocase TatA/TatE family subunit [Nitrososphaerota archaeon]MDG6920596.1 twin-arginine translocase TatA/TatE family subunit [Nitrososphaerota archaeon]